jgi:hypothetical protein
MVTSYVNTSPLLSGLGDVTDAPGTTLNTRPDGVAPVWDSERKRFVLISPASGSVLSTTLDGFTPSSGAVTSSDTVLSAFEKTQGNITNLENKYVITARFASISSTTGTVTLPTQSTVRLDDFGGTTDAIVLQVSGGKPSNEHAYTSGGSLISTTFDSSGNYVLSGTPVSYPVALVYRVATKLVDFNASDADIVGEVEYLVDPIPQETKVEGLVFEGPLQSQVLTTALQDIAHSVWETGRSGLVSWSGSGNYWSWTPGNPGTFTLLRGGEGYIRHKEVPFLSGQTVTLAYGDYKYLYINADGILQKSDTNSAEDKRSRINIFLAQNDVNGEFLAIRNDHRFTLDSGAREWMDSGFGAVLGSEPGSSDISRYGTGTGASATDRQVNITSGRLIDADIVESWSAITTGISVNHTYRRNDGFFARYSFSKEFPMYYDLNGTPTALANGEFGVYRLFMMKSSLNDNPPQFISEMNSAKYGNLTQAQTAIASGSITNFGAFNNELAQVGYVIVAMNASGGYVHSVQIEKTTLRQVSGGSGVGSTAANVVTDTSLFDKVLSTGDTTVQSALNTIDENAVSVDKAQTIAGVKTFSSFPVTPNVDPTTDYQVANKRYADTRVNVTSVGSLINGAAEKTTPVDADMLGLMDSAASNVLKKLSWSNLKATLKTYFDSVYAAVSPTRMLVNEDSELGGSTSYLVVNTGNTNPACRIYASSTSSTAVLDVGHVDNSNNRVIFRVVKGNGSTDPFSAVCLQVNTNGLLYSPTTYNNTSATSANMGVLSSGEFVRATSSIKYKTDVHPLTSVEASALWAMRPVTYKSTAKPDNPDKRHLGFIAEELADIDPKLVHFSEDGTPEGVQYDRITVLLTKVMQEQQQIIAALEARVHALENK